MALSCTKSEAVTNGACFTASIFGTAGQKRLESLLWATIMDAFLGTSYVSNPDALYLLVKAYAGSMTDDQLQAALLGVLNVAMPNTTVLPSTINSKTAYTAATAMAAAAKWQRFNDRQLTEIKVYALCNIFGFWGF